MGLPNQNTNNNLVCDDGASFQGFIFDGTNNNPTMSVVKGAETLLEFSLKSVAVPVEQYMCQEYVVKANSTILLDVDSILSASGEAQFIAFLVKYPSTDSNLIVIDTNEKYVKFLYPTMGSNYMNIGQIMMLSGTTKAGCGWGLDESPGGISIFNPHMLFDVKVKVLAFS
jgi:hypothetical protein